MQSDTEACRFVAGYPNCCSYFSNAVATGDNRYQVRLLDTPSFRNQMMKISIVLNGRERARQSRQFEDLLPFDTDRTSNAIQRVALDRKLPPFNQAVDKLARGAQYLGRFGDRHEFLIHTAIIPQSGDTGHIGYIVDTGPIHALDRLPPQWYSTDTVDNANIRLNGMWEGGE